MVLYVIQGAMYAKIIYNIISFTPGIPYIVSLSAEMWQKFQDHKTRDNFPLFFILSITFWLLLILFYMP